MIYLVIHANNETVILDLCQGRCLAADATPEEAADYIQYWNDRAKFVLENADMNGFFTVTVYE